MPAVSDQGYFDWLAAQVEPQQNLNPRRTHQLLLGRMLQTPFVVVLAHDARRAEDGRALRSEFMRGFDVGEAWAATDCSMLELLVALSRRAAFESYGGADDWFWHLLDNLGLSTFVDETYGGLWSYTTVDWTFQRLNSMDYTRNGHGGLFPLRFSDNDQTKTELWYQMQLYVLEGNGPRV